MLKGVENIHKKRWEKHYHSHWRRKIFIRLKYRTTPANRGGMRVFVSGPQVKCVQNFVKIFVIYLQCFYLQICKKKIFRYFLNFFRNIYESSRKLKIK